MGKIYKKFVKYLEKSNTEEDVKNVYSKHFKIDYDTSENHDLYTERILFEFKFDKKFENLKNKATVLSQILYYVHRLKYGFTKKRIPLFLCMANKNEIFITKTILWKKYYSDIDAFDWDLTASIPDKNLVEKLIKDKELQNLHIYKIQNENDFNIINEKILKYLNEKENFDFLDKKIITEENFEDVFEYWNGIFGDSVQNGFKRSKYFVCDIQHGRTFLIKEQGKIYFDFGKGDGRTKKILFKDYNFFWKLYEKVSSPDIIRGIISKVDRLTNEEMRRFHGEFFTPIKFARKSLKYIEKTIGKNWWKSGEYRIWDMAAGTGNLEWHLPNESYKYIYLSTLYPSDVEHCEKLFPEANIFQYDYLNDDIANVFANGTIDYRFTWKLSKKLREDLSNKKLKWIILINPPFATSQNASKNSKSKKDVSNTEIRKIMHKENLGEVSRELFSQFIFRIKKEFENKKTYFCLFSTIKYLNANNDQKLRDKIFKFKFERGFMFSSVNFSGTSRNNQFPIGFLIWNLSEMKKLEKQNIKLDIINNNIEKVGKKKIFISHRNTHLNKWIKRPRNIKKFPPLSSAININKKNKDKRDRISENFLASLMCTANNFQSQNQTAFASAPFVSAGAFSVTPENFERAMIIHAVRRIPKANWINDRDQFLQTKKKISKEFINDCIIWNIFSNSNQTASLKNVEYEKNIYQIKNNFFPFLLSKIRKWKIIDVDIFNSIFSAEDRFLAKYISKINLSEEAKELFKSGEEIYKFYFENLHLLRTILFKIETWDAGFWQIKKALKEQNFSMTQLKKLKKNHDILKNKILEKIYFYEFIEKI